MTILYADDDLEDQEVFTEIIQAINPKINILRAVDGLKTIEILFDRDAPDIIFIDVDMPYLNGYQALAEIRKNDRYKNTQVVIYSTNAYHSSYDEYASLNARFLRKPNTIGEGIATLREIIQKQTASIPMK